MNILAHIHGYPPIHNAGAEHAMHGLLSWLAGRGHAVTVYAPRLAKAGTFDGVRVITGERVNVYQLYDRAEVVITHLDNTKQVMQLAARADIPVAHFVHNDAQLAFHGADRDPRALYLFNAEWVRRKCPVPGITSVIHPPVHADRYRTTPGECVTLLNLNENKGGALFWELAKMLPDVPFIGVRGSYGPQIVPAQIPPNVTLLPNQADVRAVYSRTRILLMPSAYESWGRCAMEAAASGIPTIAHPTPGLLECLGRAGIYCDRDDPGAWVAAIRELLEPDAYAMASSRAGARFTDYAAEMQDELLAADLLLRGLPMHYVATRVTDETVYIATRNVILDRRYRRGETVPKDHPRFADLLAAGAIERKPGNAGVPPA